MIWTILCPIPTGLRDEILALACRGMQTELLPDVSHVAVNRFLQWHGRLAVWHKASPHGPHEKKIIAHAEERALSRFVWEDH